MADTYPSEQLPIERHPWEPWIPDNAKVLIMGTFPPGEHRRAMEFYYPNRTNDFWRVMGIIFRDDAEAFYDRASRSYRLDDIKEMLTLHGIALSDTGAAVRRLKGNASDKYLEIVEAAPVAELLARMPMHGHSHDRRKSGNDTGRSHIDRGSGHGKTYTIQPCRAPRRGNMAAAIHFAGISPRA